MVVVLSTLSLVDSICCQVQPSCILATLAIFLHPAKQVPTEMKHFTFSLSTQKNFFNFFSRLTQNRFIVSHTHTVKKQPEAATTQPSWLCLQMQILNVKLFFQKKKKKTITPGASVGVLKQAASSILRETKTRRPFWKSLFPGCQK